jgi:hypothetical protein
MIWLWEAGTLLVVALVLRRVLRMGRFEGPADVLTQRRALQIEPVFKPLASEFEAHSTILAVSLNDAFEEHKAGRSEAAWCMVSMFASEWSRLTDLVQSLQQLAIRYLPVVDLPVPVRNLDPSHFRSGTMIEFVRFHSFVDQFVFRPKLRFQLHLRLQRRAIAALSEEFDRTRSQTDGDSQLLDYALTQIDLYFHDLDRLAKETLLAFRSELFCLPGDALAEIGTEIQAVVSHGVLKQLVPVKR